MADCLVYEKGCETVPNRTRPIVASERRFPASTMEAAIQIPSGKSTRIAREVNPPSAAVLAALSREDQFLLTRLLTEKQSFIDHAAFYNPGIEEELFGTRGKQPDDRLACGPEKKATISNRGQSSDHGQSSNRSDDAHLFMQYNYARREVSRILDTCEYALSSPKTKKLLLWAHRALDARNTLVQLHFPLVMAMAKRSHFSTTDLNGMLSEGNLTLLRTVESFDCSRGFKFSTYSCRSILKSFSRAAMRASRFRNEISMKFDLVDERNDGVELNRALTEQTCMDELKVVLVRNLAGLNPIEHQVIMERFAIGKNLLEQEPKPKTLKQVGALIGVTKERVRQIQNKAMKKLRSALEQHYLAA